MLHSGKNGFAITDHGFYCRKLWEDTTFTNFEELLSEEIRPKDVIIRNDASIYIKDPHTTLTYCSGSKEILEELKRLIQTCFADAT